jgi:hypothetical protein
MKPEISLRYSQKPVIGPYPQPEESISQISTSFL